MDIQKKLNIYKVRILLLHCNRKSSVCVLSVLVPIMLLPYYIAKASSFYNLSFIFFFHFSPIKSENGFSEMYNTNKNVHIRKSVWKLYIFYYRGKGKNEGNVKVFILKMSSFSFATQMSFREKFGIGSGKL